MDLPLPGKTFSLIWNINKDIFDALKRLISDLEHWQVEEHHFREAIKVARH